MKILKVFGLLALVGGLIAVIGSFVVANSFESRAKLIQRVERNEGAELFGEAGTAIGSPQKLIIDDPKAFTGDKTPEGAEIVDEGYLKANNLYPLQLQTVTYAAEMTRYGGIAAIALGGLALWAAKRRSRRTTD